MAKLFLIATCLLITGCLTDCDLYFCDTVHRVSGTVVDSSNMPIANVEVIFVSHSGRSYALTTTDINGQYEAILPKGSRQGLAYLVFTSSGYQDFDTSSSPLGEKDGVCEPETELVRNATMLSL